MLFMQLSSVSLLWGSPFYDVYHMSNSCIIFFLCMTFAVCLACFTDEKVFLLPSICRTGFSPYCMIILYPYSDVNKRCLPYWFSHVLALKLSGFISSPMLALFRTNISMASFISSMWVSFLIKLLRSMSKYPFSGLCLDFFFFMPMDHLFDYLLTFRIAAWLFLSFLLCTAF